MSGLRGRSRSHGNFGDKNLRVFRDFWLLMGLRGSCGAQAKGRMRRGDFSMVRIRLARFALPRFGFSGSKSGVSCSPLVCRVLGDHRKRQSERSPARAASIIQKGLFASFRSLMNDEKTEDATRF